MLAASPARPGSDGYVFPLKTATIRVSAGGALAAQALAAEAAADPNVEAIVPDTPVRVSQSERQGGGD